MERLFVYTAPFRKSWAAMGLGDDDLIILEEILLDNPHTGPVIEGTGGARKMRIQLNNNKGKSGGGRVIYVDVYEAKKLYFLLAYPKSVQDNLTPEQKQIIKALVEAIKEESRL